MSPYIIILLWSLLVSLALRTSHNRFFFCQVIFGRVEIFILALLACLPLIIILTFREDVGTDYYAYVAIYESFSQGATILSYEPLYTLINLSVSSMQASGIIIVFAVAAVLSTLPVYLRIFQTSMVPWFSILILFGMSYPFMQTNTIRSAIAISVVFFVLPAVWKKKPIYWFSGCVIGAGFHYTALMMLPFYWLLRINYNIVIPAILLIIAVLLSTQMNIILFFLEIFTMVLPDNYLIYPTLVKQKLDTFHFGFGYFWYVLTTIFTLIFWKRLSNLGLASIVVRNSFYFGQIIMIAFYQFWAIGRIGWFFSIAGVLFWPLVTCRIFSRNSLIIFFSVAIIYINFFVNSLVNGSHDAIPYKSIFG